jgi:hypothetical protein
MRTAFIIDQANNESLLRFTETKLFFDAKNQGINFIDDCCVVSSADEAFKLINGPSVILKTGEFLTTTYRSKNATNMDVLIASGDPDVIIFDEDTQISFTKRCKYKQGTKQLYIIENMLKTCLRNRDLVYLDNTEEIGIVPNHGFEHLYGLASGWKTIMLAQKIGLDKLKSITVYDINPLQLDHAKWLHEHAVLPAQSRKYKNSCGVYDPTQIDSKFWKQWHDYPVKFEQFDLFATPEFPKDSAVWISNIFHYEPNIFKYGWHGCKQAKQRLINTNKESIIFTK